MRTTLYVIRHGHSLGNLSRIFTGHLETPLSELGEKQVEHLVEYFKDVKVDAIYSSDLIRTVMTISGVSKDKNLLINKDSSLREIRAGDWEGMAYTDIEATYPEEYFKWKNDISKCHPTGGESVEDMANRVLNKVLEIAKKEEGKTVIITTHATPIRSIISNVSYGSCEKMQEVSWFPNASICKLEYNSGELSIIEPCIIEHLKDDISVLPKKI